MLKIYFKPNCRTCRPLLDAKPIIAGNSDVVNQQMIDQSPRDVLETQIGQLHGEKRQIVMKIIEHYINDGPVPDDDSAASFLLTTNYKLDAIGMLASKGDYTNAQSLLNSFEPTSQEELNEKSLMSFYIPLIQEGKKWDSMDSAQIDQVKQLSEGLGPAASRAKTILSILGKGDLIPQIPDYTVNSSRLSSTAKHKYTITNYFTFKEEAELIASPNPSSNYTEITYRYAEPVSNPRIVIYDIDGRQIFSKNVSLNDTKLTIETIDFQSGMYHVQLMDGKIVIQSMRLVNIK